MATVNQDVNTIRLKPSTKEALIGFHPYTGNDYVIMIMIIFFQKREASMLESYGEASKIPKCVR